MLVSLLQLNSMLSHGLKCTMPRERERQGFRVPPRTETERVDDERQSDCVLMSQSDGERKKGCFRTMEGDCEAGFEDLRTTERHGDTTFKCFCTTERLSQTQGAFKIIYLVCTVAAFILMPAVLH